MSTYEYPLPSFHFRVELSSGAGQGENSYDNHFQSVSGLNVEMGVESIIEGGENRFEHQIPLRSKYSALILKRGVLKETKLIQWCRKALEEFSFEPATLNVVLLSEDHKPLITWTLFHVWPKKWSVSDFDAEKNELLIETLEMNYNFFSVKYENK